MPPKRKIAVSACYGAVERPETVASQPASHRRRPLEVAISIIDGTNKIKLIPVDRACTRESFGVQIML